MANGQYNNVHVRTQTSETCLSELWKHEHPLYLHTCMMYMYEHVQTTFSSVGCNGPYAICTDPRNPVESRRPGRVLNVQDPIVFSAISTEKWGLKTFHTKTFFLTKI